MMVAVNGVPAVVLAGARNAFCVSLGSVRAAGAAGSANMISSGVVGVGFCAAAIPPVMATNRKPKTKIDPASMNLRRMSPPQYCDGPDSGCGEAVRCAQNHNLFGKPIYKGT